MPIPTTGTPQISEKEFTLADWISAGFERLEVNKDSRPNESFMVVKSVVDEESGKPCYFIIVGVSDYAEFYGEQVAGFGIPPKVDRAPSRWGFAPRVQFRADVTLEVSVNTSDPAIAEAKFAAIWAGLGKPINADLD